VNGWSVRQLNLISNTFNYIGTHRRPSYTNLSIISQFCAEQPYMYMAAHFKPTFHAAKVHITTGIHWFTKSWWNQL